MDPCNSSNMRKGRKSLTGCRPWGNILVSGMDVRDPDLEAPCLGEGEGVGVVVGIRPGEGGSSEETGPVLITETNPSVHATWGFRKAAASLLNFKEKPPDFLRAPSFERFF